MSEDLAPGVLPMDRRRAVMMGLWGGLAALTGCAAADPAGEEVGSTSLAQLDGGTDTWRKYEFVCADVSSTPLATVYVFNKTVGTFRPGHEYWFINEPGAALVGTTDLSISFTDFTTTSMPPDPGYTNEQKSGLAQLESWGSGSTSDPVSGGSLFSGGSNIWLRLFVTPTTPRRITRIVWYQVLASGSPANVSPSGTFSTGVGSSVPVPMGSLVYDVNQSAIG